MIKSFLILLIFTTLLGCYASKHKIQTLQNYKTKKISSYSSKYLIANYSISRGDYKTVNEILNIDLSNTDLLKLKFFSNLVSGNFTTANKISNLINANERKNSLYLLPKYIINIKNGKFIENSDITQENEIFFGFKNLNYLTNLWLQLRENKSSFYLNKSLASTSLHELLILENFYNNTKLNKIADHIYYNKSLNHNDYLFLAGFYFRRNNLEKFNEIIETKITNHFNKKLITKSFFLEDNIFSQVPSLLIILSAKLYNIAMDNNNAGDKSKSFQKILLEMSLFLCHQMDVTKYSLSEIYSSDNFYKIALEKLSEINDTSYYNLPANLKKLSIKKNLIQSNSYHKQLFASLKIWPENEKLLYELADYYKSNKKYKKSLKIYEKLIKSFGENNRLLFLYASNLDKINKWEDAKYLFLKLLKKNPSDTYTLNYISYTLALRDEDIEYAFDLIKKAITLEPENGYFLDTIGWVEYKRNNFKNAVFYLEKATSTLPNSAEILDHLGDCYFKLGRKREAIYEWKKALKYFDDEVKRNIIQKKIRDNE
jgi:Tfp pilus assembly protein PilF